MCWHNLVKQAAPDQGDFIGKIGQNSLDFSKDAAWQEAGQAAREHSFFHWDLEFPDIFYGEDGRRKENPGFDAVVGNPPYANLTSNNILKKCMDYSGIVHGVVNIAALFIKKGIGENLDDGYCGFIIPKSFLSRNSWKLTRNFVLSYSLNIVNDVGKQWDEVGLEQTIIIIQKNHKYSKTKILSNFKYVNEISKTFFKKNDLILTGLDSVKFSLVAKIKSGSINLGKISKMQRGITINSSQYSYSLEKKNSANYIRVLGGTNVEKYLVKDGNKRKPNRFIEKSNYCKIKKDIFDKKRIINQRVASSIPKIIATIENKLPTDDTINNIILTDDSFSYEDILGILNSDLVTFYLRYAIINNSTLTVDLDRPYLTKIPVKNPKKSISKIVIAIIKKKKFLNNYDSEESSEHIIARISNEIKQDIDTINKMVFELYGLSNEEIRIIKESINH